MTVISIRKDMNGRIAGFKVKGHSEYADPGEDIVCAALSAITHSAAYGLECHLKRQLKLKVDKKKGELALELVAEADELSEAILMTMVIGLQQIANEYPKYVIMNTVEVK